MAKSKPAKSKPAKKSKPNGATGKRTAAKPGRGEVDYSSPEYLAAYDAETAKESGLQVKEVYGLQEDYEDTHKKAIALKKAWESARSEHLAYIRDRMNNRGKKPAHLFAEFEAKETLKHSPKPKGKGKRKAAGPSANGQPEPGSKWYPDDIWKQFPLDRLSGYGITAADLANLSEAKVKGVAGSGPPIDTMGALARFTEPDPRTGFARRLADVKGLGGVAVGRIEAATTAFWADWSGGLADRFAVECGFRRPDPLAPEVNGEGQGPEDAGETQPAGDGNGTGQPAQAAAAE